MNIKFIDNNTVKISVSVEYEGPRPPHKRDLFRDDFVNQFCKKHPSYEVEKVEGPYKVSNFRGPEKASGEWILKVKKKTKVPTSSPKLKTVSKKKTRSVSGKTKQEE